MTQNAATPRPTESEIPAIYRQAVEAIDDAIGQPLVEGALSKETDPRAFAEACFLFVESRGDNIQPLEFLSYLRKSDYPETAKILCQAILSWNPVVLTRVLG